MKRLLMVIALLSLAACSTRQSPARLALKLAPAALEEVISVQQHLLVERGGRTDELDAALEVDAEHLELVGMAFGQRILSLSYDGKVMTSWRHPMLPPQVQIEDILEDLQLTLWPAEAIQLALPSGWRIEEQHLRRTLYRDNAPVTVISYSTKQRWSGLVVLENLRYHYRLTIQSVPIAN
ncbi:MAG: DUF3261 domain-containing protein [Nitrosospira sp.]